MDTVDSIGAYWSFYSVWNSLNVFIMTQSDAPNEGREEKELREEIEKTKRILADDFGQLDMKSDLQQTLSFTRGKQIGLAFSLDIVKSLRDQLSKEREKVKEWKTVVDELYPALQKEREIKNELVDAFKELLKSDEFSHHFSTTAEEVEALIAKASELDKNQKQ